MINPSSMSINQVWTMIKHQLTTKYPIMNHQVTNFSHQVAITSPLWSINHSLWSWAHPQQKRRAHSMSSRTQHVWEWKNSNRPYGRKPLGECLDCSMENSPSQPASRTLLWECLAYQKAIHPRKYSPPKDKHRFQEPPLTNQKPTIYQPETTTNGLWFLVIVVPRTSIKIPHCQAKSTVLAEPATCDRALVNAPGRFGWLLVVGGG